MNAKELLNRADGLVREDAFDDAIGLAREALLLNPPKWDAGRAYKLIGISEWLKGNSQGAIASMKQAVTVHPEYASGCYNLACIQAQLEDKEGMLHNLAQCIKFGFSESVYDYRPQILIRTSSPSWQTRIFLRSAIGFQRTLCCGRSISSLMATIRTWPISR